MHKYRRKATYELFVGQFLAAGQKCLEFENHKFVNIYVRQARRLADLLKEDHFEIDAYELHERIRALEVLQKNPKVARSKSNVSQMVVPAQNPVPVQKRDLRRVPEPFSPQEEKDNRPFSPDIEVHANSSPEWRTGTRKSILKSAPLPMSLPSSKHMSVIADIHQHTLSDTITAKAPPSTLFLEPTTNGTTLNNKTVNGDYSKITAIELIDKGRDRHRVGHQLDDDTHVSIL